MDIFSAIDCSFVDKISRMESPSSSKKLSSLSDDDSSLAFFFCFCAFDDFLSSLVSDSLATSVLSFLSS